MSKYPYQVKLWALLVSNGTKELANVPTKLKSDVEAYLKEQAKAGESNGEEVRSA